jgi:hypothetical protein
MFNSYNETIGAGIAMVMVLVAAHWVWDHVFAQLAQHLI